MASEMYAPPLAWNALLGSILSLTSPISILCSSVKALDAALRINTYGPIFVSQTFLPEVLRSRLKTVVLISSNASSFGLKMCVSPYPTPDRGLTARPCCLFHMTATSRSREILALTRSASLRPTIFSFDLARRSRRTGHE